LVREARCELDAENYCAFLELFATWLERERERAVYGVERWSA
jgi:hypothetical protein